MHRKTDKQSLQAVGNYQQGYYNNQQASVNPQQGANSNFANYSNQFPNTANLQKANQGWDPFQLFAIFAIVPIVIFFFVVSKNASLFPAVNGNPMVPRAYKIGFEVALKSAVLVSGISLGLAMLARNTYGGVGFIALMLVCVTGGNLISNYLFAWDLDFLDKINGMVFYNLQMIPMFSLMMTCATYRDHSWKKDLAVFIGGFVLLFAYFWGDYSSTLVAVTDPDLQPISYLVMRVLKESGAARQMYMQQGIQLVYEQNSTLPIIIIPVITVAAGFIGSAFLKKEKKNTIYPQ